MSDEELAGLSPREMIALVRQVEVRRRAVEGEWVAAQARNAELEAELARRGGPPKTPQNSSTPPSKGWKRERPRTEGANRRAAVRACGNEPAAGRLGLGRAVPADALRGLRSRPGGRPAGTGGHQPGGGAAPRGAGGARSLALWGHLPALRDHHDRRLPPRLRAHPGVRAAPRSAVDLSARAAPRQLRAAGHA